MNVDIANIVKDLIVSGAVDPVWVDKITGLVRPYLKKEAGLTKSYPVGCDVTEEECSSMLFDLIPDNKYRTLVYFEDLGTTLVERDGHGYSHWKSNLKLVCWINMKKFDFAGCSIAPLIIQDILSFIPVTETTYGNYISVKIRPESEDVKSSLIFGKYSYDEAQRQYLLFPYDYFALNLSITYKIHKSCKTQIVIKDDNC